MAILILTGQQIIAADYCEISQIKNDNVTDRSRQITFPDGRQIIVIGHNHGDRDYPLQLSKLSKDNQTLNEDFSSQLRRLLDDSQNSVIHANQDIQFLRKILENNNQFKFLAVEGTQEDTDSNYQYFSELQGRLYGQISRRSLPPAPTYRWAMLLAAGAVNYLKMTEPNVFGNRKLLGFESDEASKKYSVALNKFELAKDQLKILAKGDRVFLKMINDTYGELMVIYGFYDPLQHDALLLKEAEKKMPEKYKIAGMTWMSLATVEMKAMKERDKAVVENMISTKQSGILFTGLWHLESMANMLKQRCHQENGIPVKIRESAKQSTTVH